MTLVPIFIIFRIENIIDIVPYEDIKLFKLFLHFLIKKNFYKEENLEITKTNKHIKKSNNN